MESVIFPKNVNLILEPGVNLTLSKKINLLVRGSLIAKGNKSQKITIKSNNPSDKNSSFGSLIVLGDSNKDNVILEYFTISGGYHANFMGINTTSQIHLNNIKKIIINKSVFSNSYSDDGLNIKNSNISIFQSIFKDNFSDQLDIDHSKGQISFNEFFSNKKLNDNKNGDGLDVSSSILRITENIFQFNSDKGLSIGENSITKVSENQFNKNYIAIAIKDGSKATLKDNIFNENKKKIEVYRKKLFYTSPEKIIVN